MLKAIKSGNGWTGLLIGAFFSVLGGFAVYFLTLSNKEPVYSKNSINYISDFSSKISDLSVFYKGKKVKNLTRTKLIFINYGKSTIYQQDIAPKDRIRIISSTPGVNILSVKKIYEKRSVSNINVTKNSNSYNEYFIDFDFLDREDGFIIQIIHDGILDEGIKITGTIIGSEPIKESIILKRRGKFFEDTKNVSLTDIITSTLALIISVTVYLSTRSSVNMQEIKRETNIEDQKQLLVELKDKSKKENKTIVFILVIISISITFFTYLPYSRNLIDSVFNKLTPVGYELFFK